MSGETEHNVSGWTTDTLHELVLELMAERDKRYDRRMDDAERAVAAALNAAEKAGDKADRATEKRFESTNEFRGQLEDQARHQFPRAEAETRFSALSDKIDAQAKLSAERMEDLVKQIARNTSRLDAAQGKGRGLEQGWSILLGAVALLGAGIAIATAIAH